jgi:hypothetical protein
VRRARRVEIVADCKAESPPAASRTLATTPPSAHQKTRCSTGVSVLPPDAMVSMTSEPESAEVMKKMHTSTTASVDVTAGQGRYWKNWNKATERSALTAAASAPWATVVSMNIAVLPNTVIQKKVKPAGMNSTATMNSRTVRPREMRAMNMPTKGDHEIHQAQ